MMWRPPAPRTFFLSSAQLSRSSRQPPLALVRVLDVPQLVGGDRLRVAAEDDVGAAAGHVGRDRHGAGAAGLDDDLGLLLVELGVEDDVRDLALLQKLREPLGLFDRDRSDEDRLALLPQLEDLVRDGVVLLALRRVHDVLVVRPDHGHVGRDDDDVELVDLVELRGLGVGRAGHARELLVEAEVVLERDRRERLVLPLDLDVLLGLDRLVEPVGPAAAGENAAGELVDDQDLAVLDHVLDVPPVERMGAQRLLDAVEEVDVVEVVHVVDAEILLRLGDALFGQDRGARLLVHEVVAGRELVAVLVLLLGALDEVRDDAVAAVVDVGVLFRGARR